MIHKKMNSKKYWDRRGVAPLLKPNEKMRVHLSDYVKKKIQREKCTMEKILKEYPLIEEEIDDFHSDEEPEDDQDTKKKDMKIYMDNLNSQMSTLANALRTAETQIVAHNQDIEANCDGNCLINVADDFQIEANKQPEVETEKKEEKGHH